MMPADRKFRSWRSCWPRGSPICVRSRVRALRWKKRKTWSRSEEHTSELQSHLNLVCRLLLEKKKIDYHLEYTKQAKRPPLVVGRVCLTACPPLTLHACCAEPKPINNHLHPTALPSAPNPTSP